jgi:hypothetical protein
MTTATAKMEWRRPRIFEWRRPVIMDVTPPKRRPTADEAAARHGEVRKHHRKQRKRRSEENPSKPDDVRLAHLRWTELQRLMRHRYRTEMPDTFEARRDLEILIGYAVLTNHKPQHQAELLAPWLDQDEADHMAAHQHPILHKADDLARRLDLQYCDRQALAIKTIGAVDVDQDERERRRCQRRNEAKLKKRAEAAKQQQENPMQTHTRAENLLPSKAKKVLARIDGAEIAVPELIKRVAGLKEFSKLAEPQRQVHKIVDHLKALGLVADRYAPGPKGMPVRHVSRPQQPSRAAHRRLSSEG